MPARKLSSRPALSFAPAVGCVEEGRDSYVTLTKMRELMRGAARWWTFHSMPTTVELEGGKASRYAKLWDRFTDHAEPAQLLELLREYGECGVPRPSGYADVFHARYASPRVAWSVNAMLAPAFAGGWQEAIKPGVSQGVFYKYDIRSAYLWAGSLGLPDTKTYRRDLYPRPGKPGVYRIVLDRANVQAGLPFPFNRATECLASADEIEQYALPIARVISGVTWTRELDPRPLFDAIGAVTTWKQAGRMYWGRWGQTSRVGCHTAGKSWELPNMSANIPYAHLILSRVKAKLWHAVDPGAVHVYVDSVITPMKMRTGEAVGDWKLETVYPNGIFVKGPGQYGGATDARLERMAGVPKNSTLRDLRSMKINKLADLNAELLAG